MPISAKPHNVAIPAALARTAVAPRILAADDQPHILEALELLLKPQGYKVDAVHSPVLAREALSSEHYDAVLISEFPSAEACAKFTLSAGALGNVTTETLTAFPDAEYRRICESL